MLDDFQDDDPVKNSEFLDEFRQRLNSQPIENIEERKKDISKSQHIFLGTILGVGIAGIASWFILSPDYDKTEDVEIPVIRRTNTAVKVQPANPGGMEILNQDKAVYEIVEKTNNNNNEKIENILPPTEEPTLPNIAANNIEEKAQEAVSQSNNTIETAKKIIAQEEQKNFVADTPIEQKKEIKVEVVEANEVTSKKIENTKTEEKNTPKEKDTIKVEVREKIQENPADNNATSGMWQIQLISSPNQAAMEKSWGDLTKKYTQLKGLPHEIESADLGTKGTFYRLKAGAFQTRSDADKLCNSIKSSGGSCLVKKKQ